MKTSISTLPRIALLLFLLVTIVLFYLINVNSPLIWDDYQVIRVIAKHPDGTYSFTEKMISSLRELVQSWYYHRSFWVHGRISDYVGAAILVTGGKETFNVLNTLVFVAYLWIFCKLCFHRFTLAGAAILLLTSILVTPCIAGTVFWVCGAMNYLWPSIPLAIILMGVRKLEKDKTLTKCKLMLVCLCAFLCGAFHEGLGCTLGGAMTLYWAIQRSKGNRLPSIYLWIIAILGIGTLIPLTAPAMWNRWGILSGNNGADIQSITSSDVLRNLVRLLINHASFPLLLLVICLIHNGRKYVFSLIGCFTFMNLIMAITVGHKSPWGGAYYFLGLSAGISTLSCIPQKRLSVKWGLLASCLILTLTGLYAFKSHKVNKIYNTAVFSKQEVNPCPVDVTSLNGELPLSLWAALPGPASSPSQTHLIASYHGQKPRHFGFQCSQPIPEVETAFNELSKDEPHLCRFSGHTILRLPRGHDMATPITAKQAGKPTLRMMSSKWSLLSRITAPFRNQKLARCGQFLAGDTYFIVLPEEVATYSTIEVTLVNQWGERTKSIIDLDSTK